MSRKRKKYIRQPSKYEAEKVHISTEVIKIELQNELVNEKYKTVFYCKSTTNPKGRMCVAWGKTRIVEGSKIEIDGRFKDDIFLVWKMTITNNKILPVEICPEMAELKQKIKELTKK